MEAAGKKGAAMAAGKKAKGRAMGVAIAASRTREVVGQLREKQVQCPGVSSPQVKETLDKMVDIVGELEKASHPQPNPNPDPLTLPS